MCGICGFVSRRKMTIDNLISMNETMFHRGPDDHGEEVYQLKNGYELGLAQRRLSIIDLSNLGHQPMHSNDKRISLVFNGEIYNFEEIKVELKGYSFKSNCDTEVILAAYEKWGIDCIDKFNGMFSIALFDRGIDKLFLVRDRMGKKPLYYWLDSENIVFASELKPIMMVDGFNKEIDQSVIGPYLFRKYINSEKTVFNKVYKVNPGEIVEYQYGKIRKRQYWEPYENIDSSKKHRWISYDEALYELDLLLKDSVKKRMVADVPVGCFLSGGYDSSLITALASEVTDNKLKTFCIGVQDKRYNEANYAKEIANYLGTEHTDLYIDENNLLEMVLELPKYYDEPFADASQIATMAVSKLAKKEVTVVLSGDGGDELFCGYNNYPKILQAQKLDVMGGLISGIEGFFSEGIQEYINRRLPSKVRIIVGNRDKRHKVQYGDEKCIEAINNLVNYDCSIDDYKFDESKYVIKNWQFRRMILDQETSLPDRILCKVDRATMKYSLEARCPILDYRVIEYANSLPQDYKYKYGEKKRILKELCYRYIPKELLERPKQGFSVPYDTWLKGTLKERLVYYSSKSFINNQGMFNYNELSGFVKKFFENDDIYDGKLIDKSKVLWSFFMFQQWYEEYILSEKR